MGQGSMEQLTCVITNLWQQLMQYICILYKNCTEYRPLPHHFILPMTLFCCISLSQYIIQSLDPSPLGDTNASGIWKQRSIGVVSMKTIHDRYHQLLLERQDSGRATTSSRPPSSHTTFCMSTAEIRGWVQLLSDSWTDTVVILSLIRLFLIFLFGFLASIFLLNYLSFLTSLIQLN